MTCVVCCDMLYRCVVVCCAGVCQQKVDSSKWYSGEVTAQEYPECCDVDASRQAAKVKVRCEWQTQGH